MKSEDQIPLQTIKITKEPTPRHPDPLGNCTALKNLQGKIHSRGCSVPACPNRHEAQGLCRTHVSRLRRGRLVEVAPVRRYGTEGCTVTDCDQAHHCGGYCVGHYRRSCSRGGLRAEVPLVVRRRLTGPPSYSTAHHRVQVARGLATGYACVGCGAPAAGWSYGYTDPAQLVEVPGGTPYSLDVAFYQPRCVSCCHRIGYANRLVRGASC